MSSTVKLPSGKLIDLSRFVALLNDHNSDQDSYKLSLDGLTEAIAIDANDASFISQKLELESINRNNSSSGNWDKESQLNKNKPLMNLIEQWRESRIENIVTEEETQEYRDIQQSLRRNR